MKCVGYEVANPELGRAGGGRGGFTSTRACPLLFFYKYNFSKVAARLVWR